MLDFLSGVATMGFAAGGLCFLRFWRRTRDRLFLSFAVAFWLLSLNHAIAAIFDIPVEYRSWIYLLRLVAFVLIASAIILKNVKRAK
ncbi:MAG: DUF5985 family protein [Alphaproteobacteria bacterium]